MAARSALNRVNIHLDSVMTRIVYRSLLASLLGAALASPCTVSVAATVRVNIAGDQFLGNPACSLREAIVATNQDADFQGCVGTGLPYGDDRIVFSAGLAGQAIVLTRIGAGL